MSLQTRPFSLEARRRSCQVKLTSITVGTTRNHARLERPLVEVQRNGEYLAVGTNSPMRCPGIHYYTPFRSSVAIFRGRSPQAGVSLRDRISLTLAEFTSPRSARGRKRPNSCLFARRWRDAR